MRYQLNITWKTGQKESKIFDTRELAKEFFEDKKDEISNCEGYTHSTAEERIRAYYDRKGS